MQSARIAWIGLLLVLTTAWHATPSAARDIFVRRNGNDNNNGLTSGQAFRTIQRALDVMRDGDTIYIGAGTYAENLFMSRSGVRTARIIGDVLGKKTGDRGPVIIAPPNPNAWGLLVYYAQDFTIEDIEFHGPANSIRGDKRGYGVYLYAPYKDRKLTVRRVTAKNLRNGIQLYGNGDVKQQAGSFVVDQ
ncbi:MAG: DUF1565 domain-containing protein, partial [Planctomycetota bacterium]